MTEAMYASDFQGWIAERLNDYTRAGFNDPDAPNYEPSKVPEQLTTDFIETCPKGIRLIEDAPKGDGS